MTTQGIGDIKSTERGSGARFNAGKPHTFLIPLTAIASWMTLRRGRDPAAGANPALAMALLGAFQLRGAGLEDRSRLMCAMDELGPDWDNCGRVFDYGRTKYAEWNWAKGMPWSAVISSCERHLRAMFLGEVTDPESGLPHSGHAMCNLIILWTYCETYPGGDDRPPAELFQPAEARSDQVSQAIRSDRKIADMHVTRLLVGSTDHKAQGPENLELLIQRYGHEKRGSE